MKLLEWLFCRRKNRQAPDDAIRFLGDMQRLELRPGDRFVLMSDRPISAESARRLQDLWLRYTGGDEDAKLLILDAGFRIGVISTHAASTDPQL